MVACVREGGGRRKACSANVNHAMNRRFCLKHVCGCLFSNAIPSYHLQSNDESQSMNGIINCNFALGLGRFYIRRPQHFWTPSPTLCLQNLYCLSANLLHFPHPFFANVIYGSPLAKPGYDVKYPMKLSSLFYVYFVRKL